MNEFKIKYLQRGDIITHKGSGQSYVIDSVAGDTAIAVRTITVTNISEWDVFTRATQWKKVDTK